MLGLLPPLVAAGRRLRAGHMYVLTPTPVVMLLNIFCCSMYGRIWYWAHQVVELVVLLPPSGKWFIESLKLWAPRPICLRLLVVLMRAAAMRTFCTAGSSRPISTAM